MASQELRDVILHGDRAAFRELLDPAVVWVGVYPGQLCRNREDVLEILDQPDNAARRLAPEILAEHGHLIAVDLHADPPPEWAPQLCQVLVVDEGRVVEMRDYSSRERALEAVREQL